ncbi:MAG TPA: molybdenum cofactor guanylyltransferase [Terriglobales bacterium]|nr:molybdenum cofactor guanylyltransferase [Terriglobales bacterium]
MQAVSVFVLAGGRSSRMGSDKALLKLGGKPLITRAVDLAKSITSDIKIVGDPAKYDLYGPVVDDIFHGRGPLAGIHAALTTSTSDFNLMLAVDLPFLNASFLEYLLKQASASRATVTVPITGSYYHPLCAVYRKLFVDLAKGALLKKQNKIDALFCQVNLRSLSEEELAANGFGPSIFRNLNTEEDWKAAQVEFEGK